MQILYLLILVYICIFVNVYLHLYACMHSLQDCKVSTSLLVNVRVVLIENPEKSLLLLELAVQDNCNQDFHFSAKLDIELLLAGKVRQFAFQLT